MSESKGISTSRYDEVDVQFMFKKLDMEFEKQSLTRTLAEQVLSWYLAVIALIISVLGAMWSLSAPQQALYILTSAVLASLGIFGLLISLRILRFIVDYDIQQKIIDAIDVYFVRSNLELTKYLLKSSGWPVNYMAFNPMNSSFFLVFSVFNASLIAIGFGFLGHWMLDWLLTMTGRVIYNRIIVEIITSSLIFLVVTGGTLWISRGLKQKVAKAYRNELQDLKSDIYSIKIEITSGL